MATPIHGIRLRALDPSSRRHQRAAARHLRRATRRARRIGLANAVDDSRVKWQLWRGYRHAVAAAKPPRRVVRRVVAGGVLAGLVVGGAAVGIARVRPASAPHVDDGEPLS
jgi:hypothetical protein